jgi:catechol 2,3-dioxygenase-like lactoylglutathione lyase family enzyme
LIAEKPTPDSADVCFVTFVALAEVIAHLKSTGVNLIAGPVERIGARGKMMSIYFRDPDMNLIEVANYNE